MVTSFSLHERGSCMSELISVRLSKDLDEAIPKRNRTEWVIEAIRAKLRQEALRSVTDGAASDHSRDLQALEEWESAATPAPRRPA